MAPTSRSDDPRWPRASEWLASGTAGEPSGSALAVIGVPAHATSITPSAAHTTPKAVRDALGRYSTYAASHGVDVSALEATDLGDVLEPDGPEGEERVRAAVEREAGRHGLLLAIGGDNSITYSVVRGLFGEHPIGCGLVTVDAHHDLRDGETNGSPVRRLIEAGLPGSHSVQVGIADFSNSAEYADRAREYGITVVSRAELHSSALEDVVAHALDVASKGVREVFVDIDVDVCDRAEAPACPSSAPGGIAAADLRRLAFLFARDTRVRGMDITEVDASADAADGRTVRLAALLVLEVAAGLAVRLGLAPDSESGGRS